MKINNSEIKGIRQFYIYKILIQKNINASNLSTVIQYRKSIVICRRQQYLSEKTLANRMYCDTNLRHSHSQTSSHEPQS